MSEKITMNKEQQDKCVQYLKALSDSEVPNWNDIAGNNQEHWERHFGTYSCKADKDFPFKDSADIQTGVIMYSDSTIEARFNSALNSVQFCNIKASTKGGMAAGNVVEDFLNNYWYTKTKAEKAVTEFFQRDVVEGTALLKIIPSKVTQSKKKFKLRSVVDKFMSWVGYAKDDKGYLDTEQVDTTDYVGATWRTVPIEKLKFASDTENDISEAGWIEHEIELTPSQVRQRKKLGWINVDELLATLNNEKNKLPDMVTNESDQEETQNDYVGFNIKNTKKLCFSEFWVEYDWNEDGVDEECYFIISKEKGLLMYYSENPLFDKRIPFESAQFYSIAGQILGQGLPQRLAPLNDELDILQNQIIDNNTLTNTLNGFYVPGRGYDPEKAIFRPGVLRPLTDPDKSIKWVEMGNKQLNLRDQQNFIMGLIERQSLVASYNLGLESDINKNPTLGGIQLLLKEFAVNLDPLMRNVTGALERAVRQTMMCLYETLPDEGFEYAVGKVIKREHIEFLDEWKITVLGGAVNAMVEAEKQAAMMLYQIFGQDQSGETNTYFIKENLVDKIDPLLKDEVMRTPQEVQMIQQMKAKMLELAMREKLLNQKMQEVEGIKQQAVVEEGKKQESDLEAKLIAEGVDAAEIPNALKEFREKYISSKMKQGEPVV